MMVVKATGEVRPKVAMATAKANSKLLPAAVKASAVDLASSLPRRLLSQLYWSSRAGHFYLRIFILQWTHSIVGCMRPFKIVIMNELRDFLFNNVFIHGRSVT